MAQGLGVWMIAGVRQLVALYYALGDTKTPVIVATVDMGVFVALALVLRGPFGHVGISLAFVGSSLVQMLLLARQLKKRLPELIFGPVYLTMLKAVITATAAGVICHLLWVQNLQWAVLAPKVATLIALVCFGSVFLAGAILLKISEVTTLLNALQTPFISP